MRLQMIRPRTWVSLSALLVAVAVVAVLGQPPQKGGQAAGAANSADEQQIRKAVVAFVEQYNAHKAGDVAALFAPDARMVYADGTEVNGREEIKQSFEE